MEEVQSQQADSQIYTEHTPAHKLQRTWHWPCEGRAVFQLCSRPKRDKDSHHSLSRKRRPTSRTKIIWDTSQQASVKMFHNTFEYLGSFRRKLGLLCSKCLTSVGSPPAGPHLPEGRRNRCRFRLKNPPHLHRVQVRYMKRAYLANPSLRTSGC